MRIFLSWVTNRKLKYSWMWSTVTDVSLKLDDVESIFFCFKNFVLVQRWIFRLISLVFRIQNVLQRGTTHARLVCHDLKTITLLIIVGWQCCIPYTITTHSRIVNTHVRITKKLDPKTFHKYLLRSCPSFNTKQIYR